MLPSQPPGQFDNTEEAILAEFAPDAALAADQPPQKNRRSFVEQLLSPQSLQWMMACGSGILILGFVIWLWSVGIFENPLVVAISAGTATLGLIAGGATMVRKTRYQLAGRWLTLLGALAMPLNLWLYDAQGLITLADGGHLWIPAAICCIIYAGIARVLRDATFVYTLVGGVVLTGMLFLADQSIGRFFHWLPPTKFLLAIGWISVFAERLFNKGKSEFSRENFGVAFYRAGMLVVASGLALLLGGFLSAIGSSVLSVFEFWPLTAISNSARIWACGMVTASAAGFFVQGHLRESKQCYTAGASLIAWAALILMNIFGISLTMTSVAIVAAALLTASNVLQAIAGSRSENEQQSDVYKRSMIGSQFAVGALSVLAVAQTAINVVSPINTLMLLSWWTVLQFALTAAAAWSLAWNIRRDAKASNASGSTLAAGSIIAMLAGWAGLSLATLDSQLGIFLLAAVPILVAIAGRFLPKSWDTFSPATIASSMSSTHLVMLGASSLSSFVAVPNLHLIWATSLGLAAIVYFPLIAGTIIKVACYFAAINQEETAPKKKFSIEMGANLIVFQAGVASVLLAMSRWLDGQTSQSLVMVMVVALSCTVLVSFLTKNHAWRAAFRALIVAILGSSVCIFDGFLHLDGWHRGEILSIATGIMLLVLGHVAWSREHDGKEDDTATVSLIGGGLMVAIPLAIGLMIYRLQDNPEGYWRLFHEIAAISAGLVLLGSGLICRIRSTTIAGGSLLVFFVGSLVTLVRLPDQLQNVSVVMMIGGGAFFAIAVLMSIYRDRLISLPTRIRKGEGVYQVLKWR